MINKSWQVDEVKEDNNIQSKYCRVRVVVVDYK